MAHRYAAPSGAAVVPRAPMEGDADGGVGLELARLEQHPDPIVAVDATLPGEDGEEPVSPSDARHLDDLIDDEDPPLTTRQKIFLLFDEPGSFPPASTAIAVAILGLIFLSCTTFCLETLPEFYKKPESEEAFFITEWCCIVIFTLDYSIRLVTSPDSVIVFHYQFLNIVDLISILPFYIQQIYDSMNDGGGGESSTAVFRVLRLVRIARVMKVGRYVKWLKLFVDSIGESVAPLSMLVFAMLIASVFLSSLMFFAESGKWDDELGVRLYPDGTETPYKSIPASMWWCLVTMTTVGYGDMTPATTLGKIIAACTSLVGILFLAIPITVISTNFNEEFDKHKKAQEVARARLILLKNHFKKKRTGLDAMNDEIEDLVKRSQVATLTYVELEREIEDLIEQSRKEMVIEVREVVKLAYDNRQKELVEFEKRKTKALGQPQGGVGFMKRAASKAKMVSPLGMTKKTPLSEGGGT